MIDFKEAIPLSLYIHLPWCIKKCPYCDFNSHESKTDNLQEARYIDALIKDIDSELPRIWGRTISSVFIGGGTPSLFSAESLARLISTLRSRFNLQPDMEITLEANPGTAEAEKFKAYRELGINRLSIGVQSFKNEKLKALGRIHDADEAQAAIAMAKAAGFKNFNLDLMFGLPGQSTDEVLADLTHAIDEQPTHISWYQLTIEPNTLFNAKPPVLPSEDAIWEMQEQGRVLLAKQGYDQYEISAYAKQRKRCLHNINYWEFGDYLGVGAGAHGKLTNVAEGKIERFTRHKIPERYMLLAGTSAMITEQKTLSRDDLGLEFMMNAMRLIKGVSPGLFMERTGIPLSALKNELTQAEQRGFLDWQFDKLAPTDTGLRYLNDFLSILIQ